MASSTSVFADKVSKMGSIVLPQWGAVMSPTGLAISTPQTEFIPLIVQLALPPTPPDWVPIGLAEMCADPLQYNSDSCKHPNATKKAEYDHVPCPNLHYLETETRHIIDRYRELYNGILDTRFYLKILDSICKNSPDLCGTIGKRNENLVESTLRKPPTIKKGPVRRNILHRVKRFFGAIISGILGLGGLANSFVNSAHLGRMDRKVDAIQWAFSRLDKKVVETGKVLAHLSLANEKVYTFLHHSLQEMVGMINDARCESIQYTRYVHQRLLAHIFESTLQRGLDSVMNAFLHSVVTPELLHLPLLREIIYNNPALNSSLLSMEPSLVYQFGKAYPIRLDLNELKFGFILEIPVPKTTDISPMFHIQNLGYNFPSKNATVRVPFPKYVQRTSSGRYLEVNIEICKTAPGLWFCPPEAYVKTVKTTCLRVILEDINNTDLELIEECRNVTEAKTLDKSPKYVSTPNGILIKTSEEIITIIPPGAINHISQGLKVKVPLFGVIWLEHGEYAHVIVGDTLLTSTIATAHQTIVPPMYRVPFHPPNIEWLPMQFTELQKAEQENALAQHLINQKLKDQVVLPAQVMQLRKGMMTIIIILLIGLAVIWWISPIGRKFRSRTRCPLFNNRLSDSPSATPIWFDATQEEAKLPRMGKEKQAPVPSWEDVPLDERRDPEAPHLPTTLLRFLVLHCLELLQP